MGSSSSRVRLELQKGGLGLFDKPASILTRIESFWRSVF